MARRGGAWLGVARPGKARQGKAWRGKAGQGEASGCSTNWREGQVKTISVEIRGVTPLLVHRFGEDAEMEKPTRNIVVSKRNPREEAQRHAYIANDGTFFFSAFSIPNAMGAAGTNHKLKGSRKTLRFIVPSAVRVTADTITILNGAGPAPDFEVDARPVTIPATKGRIMRYRPRFNEWGARFTLVIDDAQLAVEMAHQLLNEAGQSIGIGDFRPEKRGPFGTFRVTRFEEQEEQKEKKRR